MQKKHTSDRSMRGRGNVWQHLSLAKVHGFSSRSRNIDIRAFDFLQGRNGVALLSDLFSYKMWAYFKAHNRKTVTGILANTLKAIFKMVMKDAP